MKMIKVSHQPWRKFLLVSLLALLAFQSLGLNGLAAPGVSVPYLQSGTPMTMPLSCGPAVQTPTYCNIQIVLMLDDSGSMKSNDPGRLRNQGARNVVDVLADQYYSAAQALHEDNRSFQLPDVRVAVIHFSEGVKKKSPWFSIDPGNVEDWKTDLFNEIDWPRPDSEEYKDFYSKIQWTDFSEAFQDASQLLSLKDARGVQGDCTRRAILLFTDGTPENAAFGILQDQPLVDEMTAINETVSDLNASMPADSKPAIYITGFQISQRYERPWNDIKAKYWTDIVKIVKPDATPAEIEELIKKVETKDSLDKLPARMEEITASLINLKRFAANHAAGTAVPLRDIIPVPSFTESIRFTLYNSDTAAKLDITGPDNLLITSPDATNPLEPSGAGTPIQVWQIDNPKAGDYKVTVRDAKRPGIVTWMYAYKGLSAQFDNQPGSFEPGQPGDIKFRLVDSGEKIVSDKLNLTASVTQFGEPESPLAAPAQDGDQYTISWTPKTSRPATFKVTLSDGNKELLSCSLIFDLIGPTPTPTFTPTSTATATSTTTPTATPTEFVPTPPSIPVIAIFPQCVSPGETVTLPMSLQYGGKQARLSSLDWQGSTISTSDNKSIGVRVNPINADRGEFQVVMGPVSDAASSLQIHLIAQENADGQPVPVFDVASTIPVSTACNLAQNPSCTTGLWATWFWPLVIVLLGLLILLLVLRFRSRDASADQQAKTDVYRARDWHLLFWPLLVLFLLLLLVRWMEWCGTIPPWLFLVSILVWLVFALLIRFFYGREPSQPRPWWLLLLLLTIAFLGYLAITVPALSLLWLLLVLLLAWVILWYIGPDDRTKPDEQPIIDPPPISPADFNIRVGPPSGPHEDGSVKVPIKVTFKGSGDPAMTAREWHVRKWNVSVTSPDKELTWSVDPEGKEPADSELGNCIVMIHGIRNDQMTIDVQADAEVEVDHRVVTSAQATATIKIVPAPDSPSEKDIREVFIPFIVPGPLPPPDDLTELEGIGPDVAALLNEKRINYFLQLALLDIETLNRWLKEKGYQRMDPKTWPQQSRLADIAKRYGKEEDRQNYEAYKAWLKGGVEPDEYDKEENDRRSMAIVWNRISECAPIVLSLALDPSSVHFEQAMILPLRLNSEGDQGWLSAVEWNVSAKAMPGGAQVGTTIKPVNAERGEFELFIDPVQDRETREVQVVIQALLNGRSIEIFYGKAISVQVSPPPAADPLEYLEGIGEVMSRLLNEKGIFTFKQLAKTDLETLNGWLNEKGYQRIDPKTWPQQARLADIARKYGREEDRESYEAYKAWLVRGIEPDEVDKDEKDRRPVALAWPLVPGAMPDPLEELEGIGKDIAQVLNDKGVFTFKQLARIDIQEITAWLNECGYQRMDPKTWPQQAKLAGIAKEFGNEEDRRSYEAYKAWLKGGIEPDEYDKDEQDRRPAALVWYGTAELTEKAYPEIFGQK